MIALFFEVLPRSGLEERYLELAAGLKPELDRNGGVVFLERYRSRSRPRLLLSHQIWQDEASLARWRAHGGHYGVQKLGRTRIFEDYRLSIGPVVAGSASAGGGVRGPAHPYNDPAGQPERYQVVVRTVGGAFEAEGGEIFDSVYREGSHLWLGPAADVAGGEALLEMAALHRGVPMAGLVLVSRSYGMHDRREAPQYFEPVL